MDVKPWEPVRVQYYDREAFWLGCEWTFDEDDWGIIEASDHCWEQRVTLANGQRIIVRALSDERKAARAAMKEAVS